MTAASMALHELEADQPARAVRSVAACLVALVLALLLWSVTARLDIVVSAPGRIVPATQVKAVQAAEAGVVREVLARDGDRVNAGQVLARLDATSAVADATSVSRELAFKQLTVRAIDALLKDQLAALARGDDSEQFVQVQALFLARRRTLSDAVAHEESALRRAENERLAAVQVRDKLHATLPIVRQNSDAFAYLQRAGFIGELMANDKRRELVEREQDLKAQDATLLALESAIEQSRRRIAQLKSSFRSQLLNDLVESLAAVQRLEQEQAKLDYRSAQTELRAPHDGLVQQVATVTPGAVVAAGATLFAIVPEEDALIAEVALANADAGFVEIGHTAKLKFAAFPFQKYGMLEGRVVNLGADAADPQSTARALGTASTDAPPLAYKATIELDDRWLRIPTGGELRLMPGMAITAEIHQGRRTVMEYLLSPMRRIGNDAARER